MNVTVEELGTARIISWDNQRHRNAWSGETIAAIADALYAAGREPGVRCLVARGAGADFSAGDDLFEAAEATRTASRPPSTASSASPRSCSNAPFP